MTDEARQLVLLMTDVVGSTRLWEGAAAEMAVAVRRHTEILHACVAAHGGWRPVDQGEGDSVFAAFDTPGAAVAAAVEIAQRTAVEPWPPGAVLRDRIGLHAGEVLARDGNLFGSTVNRCARIRGLGHGGQVLLSGAVVELLAGAAPAGVAVRDLGEHRMKDLERAERIYQLDVVALQQTFPPLAGLDRGRHNLPVAVSSFRGREQEVAELGSLVLRERLVTLVGFGGMGKTRLALQVAAQLADGDGDGVWFVDLSAVTDPAAVPAEVGRVLSVSEAGVGAEAAVLAVLRGARLLLVLDNLEQVLGCAPFLARVLASAPGVRLLATSREPLRLQGEHEYALDSLPLGPAVALFAERAAAVRRGFALTPENTGLVEAICTRLDGLPLAVELAAARIKVMSVVALMTRLESSLAAVLARAAPDRPARQQTVTATIAWSYETLSPPEQLLVDRLSVFPASAGLADVEAVCGEGLDADVLDTLTALLDRSLLKAVEAGEELRYLQLGAVREFAAARLAARGEDLAAGHARHYARTVTWDRRDQELPPEVSASIVRELPNLRAALRWAQEHGSCDDERGVSGLAEQLLAVGFFAEARAAGEHFLARCPAPSVERFWTATTLLSLAAAAGAPTVGLARGLVEEARRLGEPSVLAQALVESAWGLPDAAEARLLLDEADTLIGSLPAAGTLVPRVVCREAWDAVVVRTMRFSDPDRALAASGRLDDVMERALRARMLLDRGLLAEAAPLVAQAHAPGSVGLVLTAQSQMLQEAARWHCARGEHPQAAAAAEQAVAGWTEVGLPQRAALARVTLADVLLAAGDEAGAGAALLTACDDLADAGTWYAAAAWWRLGALHRRGGERGAAGELLGRALPVLRAHEGQALTDLLGCLVETAALHDDPALRAEAAARQAGFVPLFGTGPPAPFPDPLP